MHSEESRSPLKGKAKWDKPLLVGFFTIPAFLVALIFIAYPAFTSAFYSFFVWKGISENREFVGLDNWRRLFSDPIILQCISHNLQLIGVTLFVMIPIGFTIALLLSKASVFGRNTYRTAYFFPIVLSVTIAGVLWSWVYNPQYGLINVGFRAIGLENLASPWLGDSKFVMPAVLFANVWKYTGFYIVVFMAALESVPQDIYDVATLDGANLWQLGTRILIPMLREVIGVTIAIGITGAIKHFDLIFIMTMGGPVHHSELLATYMYKQAFLSFDMGYASTIAFFLFLLTLALVVLQLRAMQQDEAVEF
jgi:raffinose/stachyose/melibiose transport system permease protein